MKNLLYLFFISALIVACANQQKLTILEAENETENDSTSYELIVLDPGFDTWYLLNSSPSKDRQQSYYEYWNQRYVNAWNYEKIWKHHSGVLNGIINYERNIDYGFDVNQKLFYYFMYVENKLGIPLISNGPKSY